ncbi:hypothetical protein V866_005155 [Kwoniella sp. B9012]|uniref:Uncharacterized protein n=2 Tax=Kwoniella TaxID=490731 RepID=A0A1B9IKK2_9TREE|nr:hypothetical protein L486_06120 [Kwoniella mangroviensis CBS 10435]OCF78929.1 hypothetical protein I204_00873 [Kwoniella mangroviensis CBS 8886]
MGRSKPRTNKRPPPKSRLPTTLPALPYPNSEPSESTFSTALSNWSANALGRLDNIPKLTQSQLTALTGAAAGIGEANFLANPANIPPQSYNPNLPIDLPASLAALFEAKLTLDREKAKLLRMQQELKGQKEEQERPKGKAVAVVEEECTCGRSHSYPPSEHSECEYECEEDCDCDCHSYIDEYDHTCDHEYDEQEDPPKRPLAEDPERLDETVRELFNWIKAVVWTIEQAAIVSGRRNWSQPK